MAGQGTLEFALVSLMLMVIFFGILDLGRGVFQRQDLANVAREGARYASLQATSAAWHSKSAADIASEVASAANQFSASLGLTASNFSANGGGIACETWTTSAAPQRDLSRIARDLVLNGAVLGFGGGLLALKPPRGGSGGSSGSGGWSTVACGNSQPGDRITVCVAYIFQPAAMRLLRLGAIPMNDCASVVVQ